MKKCIAEIRLFALKKNKDSKSTAAIFYVMEADVTVSFYGASFSEKRRNRISN